jgi:hypothetical protein
MDKYLPILASVLPTEATDEGHCAGTRSNPVKEDHVVNITSHHQTFSSRMPSWLLGSTSKRSTPPPAIFHPRSGRGTKQTPTSSRRCFNLPARLSGASAHRWPHGTGHATILSNRLGSLDDPAAPTCVLSRKSMPR